MKLNIRRLFISDAAKKCGLKEMECTCEIKKKWLKNANDREGGRQKRRVQKLGEY